MISYFILGIVYAFAAAVQPGPLQAYLISQSLAHGWRRTILAAFAPLISDGPIIILILFILSYLPKWLILVLQCSGGIFLLYLAFGAWKTWRNYDIKKESVAQSNQQTLLKATLVNFLNPNPYLGWSLVMGPLLLKGWRETPGNGIALLVGFYSTIIVSSMGIILLFATTRNFAPRISRVLVGISVIALACFGFYQLWLGTFAK
jgi:threonine/homoserine/homoserine lactone efflux protein